MLIKRLKRLCGSAVVLLALASPLAKAGMQAPGVPALAGTLKLAVTDGNCTPAAVTTTAGRNAIMVKLSSAKAQKIALITTASPIRHLFEHDQAGTSENWMSSVMLPAGTYELVSSLSGSKCSVTVN